MKILFDTSVLVAAILSGHDRHLVCLPPLQQAQTLQNQGLISTHTLAELYSVLTRIPQTKIPPTLAKDLIQENLSNFEFILLTANDYTAAINLTVQYQLSSGGIFDALIAQAALNAEVDVLLTLNPKHFTRLGSAIASKVEVPQ